MSSDMLSNMTMETKEGRMKELWNAIPCNAQTRQTTGQRGEKRVELEFAGSSRKNECTITWPILGTCFIAVVIALGFVLVI